MNQGAIIFDLDGTITEPFLDFDAIRREMRLPEGLPILEAMVTMDAERRAAAEAILDRHEQRAAHESTTHNGAAETIAELRGRGFPVAILTRNTRKWTTFVLTKHDIVVDAIRCREDGAFKPSPEPVLALCQELDALPGKSWMIGDHRYDIESGLQAGTRTILMLGTREEPPYTDLAHHVVRSFSEILPIVNDAA
jgi:HAD superfamily hydrolase (TIGR01549 family)